MYLSFVTFFAFATVINSSRVGWQLGFLPPPPTLTLPNSTYTSKREYPVRGSYVWAESGNAGNELFGIELGIRILHCCTQSTLL